MPHCLTRRARPCVGRLPVPCPTGALRVTRGLGQVVTFFTADGVVRLPSFGRRRSTQVHTGTQVAGLPGVPVCQRPERRYSPSVCCRHGSGGAWKPGSRCRPGRSRACAWGRPFWCRRVPRSDTRKYGNRDPLASTRAARSARAGLLLSTLPLHGLRPCMPVLLSCAQTAGQDPGPPPEGAVPRAGACAPSAQRRQRLQRKDRHSARRACTAPRITLRLPQAGARAARRRPTASTPRAACTCWATAAAWRACRRWWRPRCWTAAARSSGRTCACRGARAALPQPPAGRCCAVPGMGRSGRWPGLLRHGGEVKAGDQHVPLPGPRGRLSRLAAQLWSAVERPCLAEDRQALPLAAARRPGPPPLTAWCCRLAPARAWRRGVACADMQRVRALLAWAGPRGLQVGTCAGCATCVARGAARLRRRTDSSAAGARAQRPAPEPAHDGGDSAAQRRAARERVPAVRARSAAPAPRPVRAPRDCSARPARTPHAPRPCSSSRALLCQVRHRHGRRLCGEGRNGVELLLRAACKQPKLAGTWL